MNWRNFVTSLILALIDISVNIYLFNPTSTQLIYLFIYNFGIVFVVMIIVEALINFLAEFVKSGIYWIKQKWAESKASAEMSEKLAYL